LHRQVDRIILINDGRILADLSPHEMVASDRLIENGIREPLYVTAMKYAGIKVTPQMLPGYIQSLKLAGNEATIQAWCQGIVAAPSPREAAIALAIEDVCFSYDGVRPTLDAVNLQLHAGEMVAIVGKNGAGKSTLSRLLCGFVREDRGKIKVDGADIAGLSIKERATIFGLVLHSLAESESDDFQAVDF